MMTGGTPMTQETSILFSSREDTLNFAVYFFVLQTIFWHFIWGLDKEPEKNSFSAMLVNFN